MTRVKNLHGTSNRKPDGYASWKDFWEATKNRRFGVCSCISCANHAIVGAHVKKVNGDSYWYIVPLCTSCNNREDSFNVADDDLVRVTSE